MFVHARKIFKLGPQILEKSDKQVKNQTREAIVDLIRYLHISR